MSAPQKEPDGFVEGIRARLDRLRKARAEGEPSVGRQLAQIGVLGWIIVTPTLVGMFAGRWLDQRFDTGVFWAAGLLVAGVALGFWSAWRWMHDS
ncbi:MAG TPA: AtpZ/AtpI family protein [Devosiaceae bacterium]